MNDKLQTGDYCEVTREQAVELLTIEGAVPVDHYISLEEHTVYGIKYAYQSFDGVILTGITHGGTTNIIPFPDFKQRLINTVKK